MRERCTIKFCELLLSILILLNCLISLVIILRNEVAVDSQLTNSNVSRRNTFSSYLLAVSL